MAITCNNCEGIYPESAEPKGEFFVPGNSKTGVAEWICSWCVRAVERFRTAEELEEARAEHEANCPSCSAERDPDDPGPKLAKES